MQVCHIVNNLEVIDAVCVVVQRPGPGDSVRSGSSSVSYYLGQLGEFLKNFSDSAFLRIK